MICLFYKYICDTLPLHSTVQSAAHTPVLLTRELLTVALAAAVSQQNASVAREVVAIVEQAQGMGYEGSRCCHI